MSTTKVEKSPILPGSVHDLHCDLLMYLGLGDKRGACDEIIPCSLPQLKRGGLTLQVCAIGTGQEPDAVALAERQFDHYQKLAPLLQGNPCPTHEELSLRYAVENATGVFGLEPDLPQGWARLDRWTQLEGPPTYVTLTWNGPSALGGGSKHESGLTHTGEQVVRGLADRKIPIDLSHASDALARDILNWCDQHAPEQLLLLSHSNARAIQNHPRNAPDWLLQEIGQRGGVVGLAWFRPFIGQQRSDLMRHIEQIIRIAGPQALVSGADLFYAPDPYPPNHVREPRPYFESLCCAEHMPSLLDEITATFGTELTAAFAHGNSTRWLQRLQVTTAPCVADLS